MKPPTIGSKGGLPASVAPILVAPSLAASALYDYLDTWLVAEVAAENVVQLRQIRGDHAIHVYGCALTVIRGPPYVVCRIVAGGGSRCSPSPPPPLPRVARSRTTPPPRRPRARQGK